VSENGLLAGWVVQDEVYGKHEFITYAVALDASGAVRGVEILDYRETHGREVRNPNWRAQFNGKRHGAPLKLDEDIQNISGATLSCKHINEGVRRILALHAAVLK
jgi:Na+-transporting NADH:ubiquinone oxidoreductase subunit NqrC